MDKHKLISVISPDVKCMKMLHIRGCLFCASACNNWIVTCDVCVYYIEPGIELILVTLV